MNPRRNPTTTGRTSKENIMERDSSGRFLPRGQQYSSQQSPQSSLNPGEPRTWSDTGGTYQAEDVCRTGFSSTTAVMSLVGGAALGAVAMYLLDPNEGEERRSRALDAANRVLETTTDAARSAYDTTTHALHDAWDTVSHRAAGAGSAAYAAMPSRKQIRKSGRRMLGRTSDTASDWLDSARNLLPSMPSRPRLERHSKYAMEPMGVSMTAIGALALGLGAMWLMDPRLGRGRRAWLAQKANRVLNETGDFARATGRHLRNKIKGYSHEARGMVSRGGNMLTDNSIAERVRSALGRLGTRGSSIGVSCSGGCVTLTGRCVADDVDTIVSTTRSTYGVSQVNNNLEVGDLYNAPATTNPMAATPSMTPSTSPNTGNVSA
jgi:hypothetical protein